MKKAFMLLKFYEGDVTKKKIEDLTEKFLEIFQNK